MRIVKISKHFYRICTEEKISKELMYNKLGRPCVLLLSLHYKGQQRKFVIPIRSNISPYTPKEQFFPLPPNPKTKPFHHHGIHYIKIFPITNEYVEPFYIENNNYLSVVQSVINKNEKEIIKNCQRYLSDYEQGKGSIFTPDIDAILSLLSDVK